MTYSTAVTPDLPSRRSFLKGIGAAGAFTVIGSSAVGAAVGINPMTAWGLPGEGHDKVIVNVFLRGGADAINIVVPHGDDDYYRIRNSLGIRAGDYTDLDGFFGLNNAFEALLPMWHEGQAAFVQAVGSNDPTRSHFVAQPIMDAGFGPGGWLQRVLFEQNLGSPISGVTIGSRVSDGLAGPYSGAVVKTIDQYLGDAAALATSRPALEALYAAADRDLEKDAVLGAFASIDQIAGIETSTSIVYPSNSNDASVSLREAAALIKGDIGVRCVAVNMGGWDHHSNEIARMQTKGSLLAESLAAFWADLGEHQDRVIIVVNSEFGRTANQNGSGGTDHGHGGMMMLLGAGLAEAGGGQVHLGGNGVWPGLTDNDLYLGRYQPITTDFRSVYAEVATRHMGVSDLSEVVPGFEPQYLGFLNQAVSGGDVDGSGTVDDADIKAILDNNVGNDAGAIDAAAGDVNGDGRTDLLDALILAQTQRQPEN